MPKCACGRFATVELDGPGRVLACEDCAALLEMMSRLLGTRVQRRPVLGIVPSGVTE